MSNAARGFCVLPWMHLFADEGGVMYPCCRSVTTNLPNVDEQGTPWRVQDPRGLEESWNSSYMRRLRLQMIQGGRPAACQRCYAYEDLGMQSHRQLQNAKHADLVSGLTARTAPDGSAPLELRSVDLRVGNLCNLQCRMCSPQSSKALIREWAAIHGVQPDIEYFERLRKLDWFESPGFWEVFERHIPLVERLHFAGGEPLLIGAMFRFLERLAATGRAENIVLSYNTNLTVLPKAIYELWPRFRRVRLTVSVDGVGAVNDFIRHPSRWEQLRANLETVDRDCAALNCEGGLGSNTTVQLFNVFRIRELLEYLETLRNFSAPNLSILTHPDHFNVRLLPGPMKAAAAARLRECAEWVRRPGGRWTDMELKELSPALEGIIRHMHSADRSGMIPEFVRWSGAQDRHRGQRTADVLPELGPLFLNQSNVPAAPATTNSAHGGPDNAVEVI